MPGTFEQATEEEEEIYEVRFTEICMESFAFVLASC